MSHSAPLSSFRILGSIVILGKACDLIDQHQQSMAASPAKKRPPPPPEKTGKAEEAPPGQESGIPGERKQENREAGFPAGEGSKVEDIPSASSDFSNRDAVRFCHEIY